MLVFCSLSYAFLFVGDKISADFFKDESTSSFKSNERLKFVQYVAMNHIIEKGKPQRKISY